jgi:membrane-bound lytic murein transglycosylase D
MRGDSLGNCKSVLITAVAGVAILSGCATVRSSSDSREPRSMSEVLRQESKTVGNITVVDAKSQVTDRGDIIVKGIKLQNSQFDYPVTINSRVEHWIDYFTGKGAKHMARYLERSELFIPYIQPLLKANGMPEDLVYLAMIESGFNNHARSHAKAVGPWQFISATGKRYGLMVNWWVDERRDTRKSTLAAVEYLKDLYGMFQSWELAAAAYNAGEAKVARAIRRFGSKDFWVISRHRFLRPETRDYVPKIIAAAIVAKNRTQFGFPASTIHPGAGEVIAGDGEVVKVEKENESQASTRAVSENETIQSVLKQDDLEAYEDGPADEDVASTPLTHVMANVGPDQKDAVPDQPLAKPVAMPSLTKKGEVMGEDVAEFEVQSPADLLKVARAAGLAYHTVKSLNPELLRWCTPPTVGTYRIRLPASTKEKFLTTYNHTAFPRKVQFLTYKVQRGQTLANVARHFGIKVDPISDLNGISSRMSLRQGMRVLLPMPNDRSRTLASLEVRDPPEHRRARSGRRHRRGPRLYKVTYKKREAAREGRRHARASQTDS